MALSRGQLTRQKMINLMYLVFIAMLALNASYNIMKDVNLAVGIDNVLDKTYTEHLNKAGSSGFGFASNEQFNNTSRNYWARISMKF